MVRSNPQGEIAVAAALLERGLVSYCPRYRVLSPPGRTAWDLLVPFVRSYVFVRFDPENAETWHLVARTPGVVRYLPGLVHDDEIERLRRQVGDDAGAVVDFSAMSLVRGVLPGVRVRLLTGAFQDRYGAVVALDHALGFVALKISGVLGRDVVVNQPLAWCEPDAPAAAGGARRAESSRGKRRQRRLRSAYARCDEKSLLVG